MGIVLRLEDDEAVHELAEIPESFEELTAAICKTLKVTHFKLKYENYEISSTRDMFVAYLNNKSDTLEFIVDEDISVVSYMGDSVSWYMEPMSSSASRAFAITDGRISKEDLLVVIKEMTEQSKLRLVACNEEFVKRRLEVYKVDENRWREIAFEQLNLQETLITQITEEICKSHSITHDIFQKSCVLLARDREVAEALEQIATKTLEAGGEIPSSLTKEKLREVLTYTCEFLENHLRENPPSHPLDFVLLKVREGDEVVKKFGYSEAVMCSALKTYEIDTLEEWADIRERLENLMQNALG